MYTRTKEFTPIPGIGVNCIRQGICKCMASMLRFRDTNNGFWMTMYMIMSTRLFL